MKEISRLQIREDDLTGKNIANLLSTEAPLVNTLMTRTAYL